MVEGTVLNFRNITSPSNSFSSAYFGLFWREDLKMAAFPFLVVRLRRQYVLTRTAFKRPGEMFIADLCVYFLGERSKALWSAALDFRGTAFIFRQRNEVFCGVTGQFGRTGIFFFLICVPYLWPTVYCIICFQPFPVLTPNSFEAFAWITALPVLKVGASSQFSVLIFHVWISDVA